MDASLSFYERLEVTRFSTQSEIKLAYENKTVEMRHTDRYTRGLLIEAFSVLKDIEQKDFYDKGFRMGQLKIRAQIDRTSELDPVGEFDQDSYLQGIIHGELAEKKKKCQR